MKRKGGGYVKHETRNAMGNYHYEIIAWKDANATQEAYHANCTTKAEALRIARKIRKCHESVELNKVFTDGRGNYIGFKSLIKQ